ncbi:MAG: amidohydrolase [Nostocoides sp.]
MTSPHSSLLATALGETLAALEPELIQIRRDLHRHPELSGEETRSTAIVAKRLAEADIRVRPLPGTGLLADIGAEQAAYRVALRADLDALPVADRSGLPWASEREGVCHACGHDVHTVALIGAALALRTHDVALRELGIGVRLLFQPAEETIPGGAHDLIAAGALDEVDAIFALHCDPSLEVGRVGLRDGAITAACDRVTVRLSGRGGHTSRPHLTEDLTFALAKVVTEVPAALSRRLDPRAGAALVWGSINAGRAANVIPSSGECTGTLRMLDAATWEQVGPVLDSIVAGVVAPYGVTAILDRAKGMPPVVNHPEAVDAFRESAAFAGLETTTTTQSLGGEDFAWYVQEVPGAMARLGTRTPGGPAYDLHQGDLVVDEDAIVLAARLLAGAVVAHRVKAPAHSG